MFRRVLDWCAFRWARFRVAHLAFGPATGTTWLSTNLAFNDLLTVRERGLPAVAPYDLLAAHYNTYASCESTRYSDYVRSLRRLQSRPLRSVLDLGCGTGGLVKQLAQHCERVVGLDGGPAMLTQARRICAGAMNVGFVAGDFRQFDLGEQFDVITCFSDGLNYMREAAELDDVLDCVERHLQPGGVFLFDVLTDQSMHLLNGKYLHHLSDKARFVLSFNYDPQSHVERTYVIFREGLECHKRIPIEPADVRAACGKCGLAIVDQFWGNLCCLHFTLEKEAAGGS